MVLVMLGQDFRSGTHGLNEELGRQALRKGRQEGVFVV